MARGQGVLTRGRFATPSRGQRLAASETGHMPAAKNRRRVETKDGKGRITSGDCYTHP